MVTLSSCFILPLNRIWLRMRLKNSSLCGPAINLQKILILAKKIISSDEVHFDLGGYVNKQNWRTWGTENTHAYIEKPTHPKRFTDGADMVVYTLELCWEVGLRSTYRRCRFWLKNHLFRWRSFWSWQVCKQVKLSHLGHRKPACIHWNADAPKTIQCLVQILV